MRNSARTVLVVDNAPASAATYERWLNVNSKFSYQLIEGTASSQMLSLCQAFQVDGILLETRLLGADCCELLSRCRSRLGDTCPPVLVIGDEDINLAVNVLKAGAADYLVKGQLTSEILDLSLRTAIENAELKRELQQSQERFQTSIENMMDCFGIYTAIRDEAGQIVDFRIDYVNAAACRNNHMTREQQMGKGLCEVLPGHRDSGLFEAYCRLVETGEPVIKDSVIYDDTYGQDRTLVRAFDIRATKLNDGFVASWRDITERKRTETALQRKIQQEKSFRRVLDNIFSFVGVLTLDGTLIEANRTALNAAALKPEDVLGRPFEHTYWWSYSTAVQTQLRTAIAQAAAGETVRYDVRVRLSSDRFITIDFALVPLLNGDNQVEYLIPSGVDITHRAEIQASLRATQEQLEQQLAEIEAIYQTAPIGLNLLDRDLRFVRINQRLAEVNGLPVEAHIGRTIRELLPDLADTAEQLLRPIFETGEPVLGVEVEGETPAMPGVKRVWRESFLPLKDGDEVIGISTVCEEITQRKQVEQEYEERLQHERQVREAAEQANRVKDEFLAILSHELRSPLNPILGWARLLQTRSWSAEKTARALATIERNAKLQTKLIDDLLDVARILRGKLRLEMTTVNLAFVIRNAIETVQSVAHDKAIALTADLQVVGTVEGDPARLQQVVWNLLTNAIKFTPENGQVRVQLWQDERRVHLVVTDSGIGIHPEFLPHIFESFRQKDASVTRQFGGLGLGLSIVRYLVEAHGGTIRADSPGEGQGATFRVSLPQQQMNSVRPSVNEIRQHEIDLTGVRVMAIDDHLDSLELIDEFLGQRGAIVVGFTSAAAALDAFEIDPPDILVSDIGMPHIDGYELIRQIRSRPADAGGNVPAIAMTAYAHDSDRQRALTQGYQEHLAKPIEAASLVQVVADLINKPGSGA